MRIIVLIVIKIATVKLCLHYVPPSMLSSLMNFFFLCFSGLFSDRILPCCLDWPRSHEPSALASLVLELQACATKSLMMSFIFATIVGLDTLKGSLY